MTTKPQTHQTTMYRKLNFFELLKARHEQGLRVCVGIDPILDKIQQRIRNKYERRMESTKNCLIDFCIGIVEATKDYACAFKLNSAFFEAHGPGGMQALEAVISFIHTYTEVPVIYDAKRGDVGDSSRYYAESAFEIYRADAITLNPLMGQDSLQPFLDYIGKGCFILCHTSNLGAKEIQELEIKDNEDWMLYQEIAYSISGRWNRNGNCGLVVGATFPEQLAEVRRIVGDSLPILIPGIGKQGGDLEKSVMAAKGSNGKAPFLINSSSKIIYSEDPRAEAKKLHEAILQYL